MLNKVLKGLVLALFLGAISVAALGYYLVYQHSQAKINLDNPQLISIKKGQFANSLLNSLKSQGILEQNLGLKILIKIKPRLAQVKTGTYELVPGMTGEQVLGLFASGREKQFSITLVEGLPWKEWYQQIIQHPYLNSENVEQSLQNMAGQLPGASIEGWLLPDTYYFQRDIAAIDLIKRAHQSMQGYLDATWQQRAIDLPYENSYEALIMASIIEKETGVASERPRIAGVFVNRLRLNMRLQTDPTVIYGMGDDFDGNIRRKDLRAPTPYNTYVIKGLPPTPIAMPSKLAIFAALNPLETDELYFVAKGDGTHKFSVTLQQHNDAVRQYQLKR